MLSTARTLHCMTLTLLAGRRDASGSVVLFMHRAVKRTNKIIASFQRTTKEIKFFSFSDSIAQTAEERVGKVQGGSATAEGVSATTEGGSGTAEGQSFCLGGD